MNSAPQTRWLVLSYFTGIDGMACSQHLDDRLPLLLSKGIEPLLLTGICGDPVPGLFTVRVPCLAPSGFKFELRHLRRRKRISKSLSTLLTLLTLPFYLLEKLVIDIDSEWSWFLLAIKQGDAICRDRRPDLIYSTGGPASAHVAAALIAKHNGLPWIAEFQDPLVHDDWLRGKRALKLFTILERFLCKRADAVVFLTDEARKRADGRTGLGTRGWTIYPGASPAAMPAVSYERGPFCRIAHFGSLGGSRNLKVFLEALKNLLSERPLLAEVIRLDVFGVCDRLSLGLIRDFPVQHIIQYHGRAPRSEALLAMKRCDILLLIQNTEKFSTETIPSKTYEYFFAGRPILALVYRNPEFFNMLSKLGHTVVKAEDPEDVKKGIAAMVECWMNGCLGHAGGADFEIEQAVDTLVSIGQHVLRGARLRPGRSKQVQQGGNQK